MDDKIFDQIQQVDLKKTMETSYIDYAMSVIASRALPDVRDGRGKMSIEEFLKNDEQKDLLRFLTAGSVDDGKSTLIGRLLFDSKKLYEDQLDALERDSKRVGNAGEHIDYALLLDGLKAEREQGITIDVAYRYFSTNHRKFIIADTPGHEQYTRNMITGGSTANLAVSLSSDAWRSANLGLIKVKIPTPSTTSTASTIMITLSLYESFMLIIQHLLPEFHRLFRLSPQPRPRWVWIQRKR